MHDALEAAQVACDRKPKDAEAWYLLGCISRYTQMPVASDNAFARAATLSRKRATPHRVGRAAFEALVKTALSELSPDALRRLRDCRVEVKDLPSLDEIKAGLAPDALSSRRREGGDVLTVFQVNHENRSSGEPQLKGLLARTLARA